MRVLTLTWLTVELLSVTCGFVPQAFAAKYEIASESDFELSEIATQLAVTPDGRFFIAGTANGLLRVYDSKTFKLVKEYRGAEVETPTLCNRGYSCRVEALVLDKAGAKLGVVREAFHLHSWVEIWDISTAEWSRERVIDFKDQIRFNESGTKAVVFGETSLDTVDLASGKSASWERESFKGLPIEIHNAGFYSLSEKELVFVLGFPASAIVDAETAQTEKVEDLILSRWSRALFMRKNMMAIPDPDVRSDMHPKLYKMGTEATVTASLDSSLWRWILGFDLSSDGARLIAYGDHDWSVFDLKTEKEVTKVWGNDLGTGLVRTVSFLGGDEELLVAGADGVFAGDYTSNPTKIIEPSVSFFFTETLASPSGDVICVVSRDNNNKKARLTFLKRSDGK